MLPARTAGSESGRSLTWGAGVARLPTCFGYGVAPRGVELSLPDPQVARKRASALPLLTPSALGSGRASARAAAAHSAGALVLESTSLDGGGFDAQCNRIREWLRSEIDAGCVTPPRASVSRSRAGPAESSRTSPVTRREAGQRTAAPPLCLDCRKPARAAEKTRRRSASSSYSGSRPEELAARRRGAELAGQVRRYSRGTPPGYHRSRFPGIPGTPEPHNHADLAL